MIGNAVQRQPLGQVRGEDAAGVDLGPQLSPRSTCMLGWSGCPDSNRGLPAPKAKSRGFNCWAASWQDRRPAIPGGGPGVWQGESTGRDHVTRPGQSRQLASLATGARFASPRSRQPWRAVGQGYGGARSVHIRPRRNVTIMAILPAARRQLVLLSAGQSRPRPRSNDGQMIFGRDRPRTGIGP